MRQGIKVRELLKSQKEIVPVFGDWERMRVIALPDLSQFKKAAVGFDVERMDRQIASA